MKTELLDKKHPRLILMPTIIPTFRECVSDSLSVMEPEWSNSKHRNQWRVTLREASRGHHKAMPCSQLLQFIYELESLECNSVKVLKILILTATRTSETLNTKASEMDFKARFRTIPAQRKI